jgi:hypothetical protein
VSRLLLLPLFALAAPLSAQETQASAAAKFSREFAASDANGDGVLTKAEVAARMNRMKVAGKAPDPVRTKRLTDLWFGRADANANGKVTEAEAQALLASVFKRYDANGDGKLGGVAKSTPKPTPKAGR